MKKRSYKTSLGAALRAAFGMLLSFAVVLVIALNSLGSADDTLREEGRRTAEDAVRRAAVSCYAIEGAYPESYDYLRKNYGVAVDETKYAVHYSVFASNIMPDITVVAAGGEA